MATIVKMSLHDWVFTCRISKSESKTKKRFETHQSGTGGDAPRYYHLILENACKGSTDVDFDKLYKLWRVSTSKGCLSNSTCRHLEQKTYGHRVQIYKTFVDKRICPVLLVVRTPPKVHSIKIRNTQLQCAAASCLRTALQLSFPKAMIKSSTS